ncbi:Cysteine synthase K M:Cysteine synthase B protein [Rutstroemia sp. NJR-2017a BBW]|nr:Cysteine synthase K M:Cysteine synthase B protein [Rutstroemia sp. NJR-2017a BBW]
MKSSLYGGLAQQEPTDPRGIMCRLRRLAKRDKSISYPGQYNNDHRMFAGRDPKYGNSFQKLMYSVRRLELVVSTLRYIMRVIAWWRLTVEC